MFQDDFMVKTQNFEEGIELSAESWGDTKEKEKIRRIYIM
jgi:hypothetical protein